MIPPVITHGKAAQRVWPVTGAWQAFLNAAVFCLCVITANDTLARFGVASFAWLLIYAFVVAQLLVFLPFTLRLIVRNANVIVFGCLVALSALWARDMSGAIVSGVQIIITGLVGLYFGVVLGLRKLAIIVAIMASISCLLSILNFNGAFGQHLSYTGGFTGIFTNKNIFSQCLVTTLLTMIFVVMPSISNTLLKLLVSVWIAILFGLLLISESVSSLIIFFGIIAVTTTLVCLRYSEVTRFAVLFTGVGVLIVMTVAFFVSGLGLADILAATDKDITLTGRTLLWEKALTSIRSDPLIGLGYASFWSDPQYLSFIVNFQEKYGAAVKGFHNIFFEILVAFGVFGLFVFVYFVGRPVFLLTRPMQNGEKPDIYVGWALKIIIFAVCVANFEPVLYRQNEFFYLIIAAFTGAAYRRVATQPVPTQAVPPQNFNEVVLL